MSYSYDKFLRPLTSSDRNIQIQEDNGIVKWTIEPFSIINAMVSNNLLKINVLNRVILVPFSSQNESKLALEKIQLQIDELRSRTPNSLVSLEIKNYVDSYVSNYVGTASPNYFKDMGSYLTPINDDKSLFISGTYGIGTLTDVEVNNNVEFSGPGGSGYQFYNIHHSGNKFYIAGGSDIFITDNQLNVLTNINNANSYTQGIRISAINEIGNKIYFATDNTPGALYVLDMITEEIKFRGYGSPTGILFNATYMPGLTATNGWGDLSNITTRSYSSFPAALDHTPPNSVGEEMVMWDTINNKYYTIMFSVWQAGGGGAITYDRREIISTEPTVLGSTVSFVKTSGGSEVDIIEGNAQLTRGNNKGLYNPAFEVANVDSYFWDINYNPVNNKVYTYDYEQGKILVMSDDLILESEIIPISDLNPWGTAYSIGINTTNGDIYIIDDFGYVLVYDINNNKVADLNPAIPFNNNGEDLLVYNPSNDTMYISDKFHTVYLFDGATRTLLGDLDLIPYVAAGINTFNSISYSSGEILLSGLDNNNNGIIIRIDSDNTITNLTDSYLSDKIIINTIKVNGQYAYIGRDVFTSQAFSSFMEINPPSIVQYENKIIGGSASVNRTHQLQDSDGVIAHLSDIPTPPSPRITYINNTVYVDSLYGDNSTGQFGVFDRPFLTISAAYTAASLQFSRTSDSTEFVVYVRAGIYQNVGIINLAGNKYVDFHFENGTRVDDITFTDNDSSASIYCNITGYADFNIVNNVGYPFMYFTKPNTSFKLQCNNIVHFKPSGDPNIISAQPTSGSALNLSIEATSITYTNTIQYGDDYADSAFRIDPGTNFNMRVKNMIIQSRSGIFAHRPQSGSGQISKIYVDIDNLRYYSDSGIGSWKCSIITARNLEKDSVINFRINRSDIGTTEELSVPSTYALIRVFGKGGTISYEGNILMTGMSWKNGIVYMDQADTTGDTWVSFKGNYYNGTIAKKSATLFENRSDDGNLKISGHVSDVEGDGNNSKASLLLAYRGTKNSFVDFVSETKGNNSYPIIMVNDASNIIAYNCIFFDSEAKYLLNTEDTHSYTYLGRVVSNRPNNIALDSASSLFTADAKLEKVPKINI